MSCKNTLLVVGSEENKVVIELIQMENSSYKCIKKIEIECDNQALIHSCIVEYNIIYAVDTNNNQIISCNLDRETVKKCQTGKNPRHLCKINNLLYVTNFESESVSIIDGEYVELVGIIKCNLKPHGIVARENKIYVACYEEKKLLEIDVNSYVRRELSISANPLHLICGEKCIFSLSHASNGSVITEIDVIDYEKLEVIRKFIIKDYVTDFIFHKENNLILCISIENNGIYIVDLNTEDIKKQIYSKDYFEDISVNSKIYIANSRNNQILILDKQSLKVVNSISTDFTPQYIKLL